MSTSKLSNTALVGVIALTGFILLIVVVVEINKIKKTVNTINESTTVLGGQENESRNFNLGSSETETQSIPIPGGWCIDYIEFTSYSTTSVSGNTQFKIGTTLGGNEIKSLTSTGLGSSTYTKLSTNSYQSVSTEASCVLTDTTAYLTLVNSKATSLIIQAHIYYRTLYNYAGC
jgi:hypothetical protein